MRQMKINKWLKNMLSFSLLFFILTPVFLTSVTSGYIIEHSPSQDSLGHLFNSAMVSKLFSKVSETKLHSYVDSISSFGPHPTGSDCLENVLTHIYNSFQNIDVSVEFESWKMDGLSGKNIIATIPGKTDNSIIVTAHADTVAVSPGADDDASGIAANLMIAEILNEFMFNSTIKFIIFTGEENGCLGSTSYVEKAVENQENIIGVLSLDKIGYARSSNDGRLVRHHANKQSSWMIDISEQVAQQYHNQVGLEVVRLPFDASSDHRSFVACGFSGTNLVEESLNPVYHTSEDTIEYLNSSYLAKVTKLALGVIVKMAQINPTIDADDISISMAGTIQSSPSLLTITVENKRFLEETADVFISIEMKHVFRDSYVLAKKEYYTEPCLWNFTKEIDELWEFKLGPRMFTQGFFVLSVSVVGVDNDISLFKEKSTLGLLIYPNKMFLFP